MERTQRIRALNDRARHSFAECRVHLTPAVRDHDSLNEILHGVQHYSSFTTRYAQKLLTALIRRRFEVA